MTYSEPLQTFFLTLLINAAWTSFFSIIASIVAIVRLVYLIKRDIDINHNGSFKSWFRTFKKNRKLNE